MLGSAKIVAFVATKDGAKARAFYVDVLGLRFVSDDQFALVVDANGTTVRIAKTGDFAPHPFTALGWEVANIKEAVKALNEKGVAFERWGFMEQDELGIWTAPE